MSGTECGCIYFTDGITAGTKVCLPCKYAALKASHAELMDVLVCLVDWEKHRHPPRMGLAQFVPSLQKLINGAEEALKKAEALK